MRLIVLVAIYLTFLSACGVSKEMYPERSDRETPDIPGSETPGKDKSIEEAGTYTEKRELLKITAVNDAIKVNTFALPEGAEKFVRLQKQFRLPIHMNGWLVLTDLAHSSQRCTGQVAGPKFFLMDDLFGVVELLPEQKVTVRHEKLYVVKVVFENSAQCTGIDIQFGVFFGQ